jgi:hypothetical protein
VNPHAKKFDSRLSIARHILKCVIEMDIVLDLIFHHHFGTRSISNTC